MYSICNKCYEVYSNPKLKGCPKATCAGKIIDVDELMIPAIISLNKKGYTTSMCCSSHEFGIVLTPGMYGARDTWINFKDSVISLPSIPEGFILRPLGSARPGGRVSVRIEREPWENKNPSLPERQTRVFDGIISLTKWADELPERISPENITFRDIYNRVNGMEKDRSVINISKHYTIYSTRDDIDFAVTKLKMQDSSETVVELLFNREFRGELPELISIRVFTDDKLVDSFDRQIDSHIDKMVYLLNDAHRAKITIDVLTDLINKQN